MSLNLDIKFSVQGDKPLSGEFIGPYYFVEKDEPFGENLMLFQVQVT